MNRKNNRGVLSNTAVPTAATLEGSFLSKHRESDNHETERINMPKHNRNYTSAPGLRNLQALS